MSLAAWWTRINTEDPTRPWHLRTKLREHIGMITLSILLILALDLLYWLLG